MLHLRQNNQNINIFVFSIFLVYNNLCLSGLYSSDNSFGSRVFWNFTIEGNGNSSVQELKTVFWAA